MADETLLHYAYHIAPALAKLLLFVVALPLVAAYLAGVPVAAALVFTGSTLLIEYGAAPVGIGLGFSPVWVLVVLTGIALGVTLSLFDIIDTLGEHSGRVRSFLQRSEEQGKKSRFLANYGIYGLVPCVMTLGFYACPPVSCVFGWRRDLSVLMIMTGYVIASVITILITLGIIDLFFR